MDSKAQFPTNARFAIASPTAQVLPERAIYVSDNLPVLRGINCDMVDLIYLDPPFNTGRGFPLPGGKVKAFDDTWKWSEEHKQHRYALGIDSPDAVAVVDTARLINGHSHGAYLVYMGVRLLEMRRILKPTGSIYFHCDPTMSHSVKLLMDAIFGRENYLNQIIWHYATGGAGKRHYARKYDTIMFYSCCPEYYFDPSQVMVPRTQEVLRRLLTKRADATRAQTMTKLPIDVWTDMNALNAMDKERTGYPTQKPLIMLQRIIKASSAPGDLVLDPFCGCATTCIAAEMEGRRWIGIDLFDKARGLVEKRLIKDGIIAGTRGKMPIEYPDIPPRRTDLPRNRLNRKELLTALYDEQKGKCNGCNLKTRRELMDIDHINPKARGGSDAFGNLQLLCRSCNTIKGAGTMEQLFAKLAEMEKEKRISEWRTALDKKFTDRRAI